MLSDALHAYGDNITDSLTKVLLWNVACDYVINGWLREMGLGEMPAVGGL